MSKILSVEQQHEIARMQAAIVNIDRLRLAINKSARDYNIQCRALQIPSLSLLAHELEGVLFEASCLLYEEVAA